MDRERQGHPTVENGRDDRCDPVELIPAIDLRGGRVVRLIEGDFGRETTYDTDPLVAVRRWVGEGARRLHVVDLDGARAGRQVQAGLIGRVVTEASASGVPCQVAGGLRDGAAPASALSAGADRVVLGTALLNDSDLAARLVAAHGASRIVAAVDVRDGQAVGEAWRAGRADGRSPTPWHASARGRRASSASHRHRSGMDG
jgi:phosphoribosylformimino-5-aminoimidazole carboxamide ribotide isomerase